ncbi:MAG: hypothetical protein HY231_26305 [Acidobacteria bacterium]|nr:hypothetical protein [Acidobacteriota bacterium]
MQILATLISLSLWFAALALQSSRPPASDLPASTQSASSAPSTKQLFAVRGLITRKQNAGKGVLQLTIKPAKDFAEVTVTVRENDSVGSASSRADSNDLSGLLGNDASSGETLTAAELDEGDIVSIIYDPQAQNRALEIYLH